MTQNNSSRNETLPITKPSDLESATKTLKKRFFHLEEHTRRNKDTSHINYKIYYLLCNPYTFVNAYAKMSKNKGALSKGVEKEETTFFGRCNANQIAKKFKDDNYQWRPVRRTWIPKPGKPFPKIRRPIDTPTQEDRIVQEAIRGILEAIFEPEFEEFEKSTNYFSTNYGFRPKKSTWDAVQILKYRAQRCNICIEGDIKSAYNTINQTLLLEKLQTRIKDKKFIKLIKNLLKSGIMDENEFVHSLTGTPQGSRVSPLLFNIYMFKLEKHIYYNIIKPIYENAPKIQQNPAYKSLVFQTTKLSKQYKTTPKEKREPILKEIKRLRSKRQKLSTNIIATTPKAAVFSRYADDWVLLMTCTYKEANEYKRKISEYIQIHLNMNLDNEKTLITPLIEGISFLGFTIIKWSKKQFKNRFVLQNRNGQFQRSLKITTSNKINILPDKKRLLRNLTLRYYCQPNFNPIGKRGFAVLDEYEIVLKYRQIMLGILEYYKNCDNTRVLNQVSYILQYSCAKTLATRKKITISKIFKKYGTDLNIRRTFYLKNNPTTKQISFLTYVQAKRLGRITKETKYETRDPFYIQTFWRTKLKIYTTCCICGSDEKVGMHDMNSLRQIDQNKRDKFEYIRSKLKRIQIPVCHKCHIDITNGRYDQQNPIRFYNQYIAAL
uniref:Reverse transcriptase domain-containing protein n=1 Tax=Rhipiliopsis peltata TaxID=2320810 RepID=A0A386B173_9CHLO|nr:hypothetical protein [Rhipiliopsis peltata]AYC65445.1 hypothetical protein [Rhipiliopsis peltata]